LEREKEGGRRKGIVACGREEKREGGGAQHWEKGFTILTRERGKRKMKKQFDEKGEKNV